MVHTCHPALQMHFAAEGLNMPFPEQTSPFSMPSTLAPHASASPGFSAGQSESPTCTSAQTKELPLQLPLLRTWQPSALPACDKSAVSYCTCNKPS